MTSTYFKVAGGVIAGALLGTSCYLGAKGAGGSGCSGAQSECFSVTPTGAGAALVGGGAASEPPPAVGEAPSGASTMTAVGGTPSGTITIRCFHHPSRASTKIVVDGAPSGAPRGAFRRIDVGGTSIFVSGNVRFVKTAGGGGGISVEGAPRGASMMGVENVCGDNNTISQWFYIVNGSTRQEKTVVAAVAEPHQHTSHRNKKKETHG